MTHRMWRRVGIQDTVKSGKYPRNSVDLKMRSVDFKLENGVR